MLMWPIGAVAMHSHCFLASNIVPCQYVTESTPELQQRQPESRSTLGQTKLPPTSKQACSSIKGSPGHTTEASLLYQCHATRAWPRPGFTPLGVKSEISTSSHLSIVKGSMIHTGKLSSEVTSLPMYCWNCLVPHTCLRICNATGRKGEGQFSLLYMGFSGSGYPGQGAVAAAQAAERT
eukprot:1157246-Pelagomonas_calceolata.AAC.5